MLRLLAMLYIVILHILGHGGILKNSIGASKYILSLIDVAAVCAVDIYAMISGYVGYTDKPKAFKSSKFLIMWSQVFCYSFGIALIVFLVKPDSIGIKNLVRTAFPIASSQYWYFSSYAALFFLIPWLNKFIRLLSDSELTKLIVVLFGLFSLFMTFAGRLSEADPFLLSYGYSTIWLTVLYVMGAWIKRVNLPDRIDTKYAWLVLLSCTLVSWLFHDVITGVFQTGIFVTYTSSTIVLVAMSYVVIFSKIKSNKVLNTIVSFFAPAAFGVYLIHDNNLVREHFIGKYFGWMVNTSVWLIGFEIIGSALAILLVCLLIEKFRQYLFEIIGIKRLLIKIGDKCDYITHILWTKLMNKTGDDSSSR